MPLHSLKRLWPPLLGIAVLLAPTASCTAVNVALEASFGAPPYLLELLETAAQENSSSYFPILDRIAEGWFTDFTSDQELYNGFLQILKEDGHFRSQEALSTFNLALSLHAAAPRIEAHYQYYNTTIDPILWKEQDASCPAWVHFDGKQYCSPTLERAQQDFHGPDEQDLPFDRTFGAISDDVSVATLYVDVNSPLFGQFHQTLYEKAKTGQSAYRVRYRPQMSARIDPLRVSGYGVELQLKRTDYIVIDDREAEVKSGSSETKPVSEKDIEDVSDLKPLSASELRGLGLKTSTYILAGEDPLDRLVKVTQDFPKYSSTLAKLNITTEFVAEHESNRQILLPEGLNVLWMNGLQIAWRQMDAFALLERLRQERAFVHGLQAAGLSAPEAIALISHSAITDSRTNSDVMRYDWRDEIEGGKVIVWLNDIEKDSRYAEWPRHSSALLQRMFPGAMPSVRRDIHNIVVPLDLSTMNGVESVVEILLMLVRRQIPVRFGFVPASLNSEASQQARVVYYLRDFYGIGSVISYLQGVLETKKPKSVNEKCFMASIEDKRVRGGQEPLSFKDVLASEDFKELAASSHSYLKRLGAANDDPPAFINGVPVPQNDQWLQIMSNRVSMDLQTVQQRVYTEVVPDDLWLAGEFIVDAPTHRNPLIVPEDEDSVDIVRLDQISLQYSKNFQELRKLDAEKATNASDWNHIIVVADSEKSEGTLLRENVLSFKRSKTSPGSEVYVISNSDAKGKDSELVEALGFRAGQTGLVVNGRRVGPITTENMFSIQDIEELVKYERTKRVDPVVEALSNLTIAQKIKSPLDLASISTLVALSAVPEVPQGIYDNQGAVRMDSFNEWQDRHTVLTTGDNKTATVQIVGSIDPTSELAQRWVPIINALSELQGVYVKIFLNPRENLQQLPVKRFYRYVIDSKPQFSEEGSLVKPGTSFEGVPREALLNLGLDVPPAWLVSAKDSIYDLDNLKLSAVNSGNVDATYELEYILIEGHSKDTTAGGAPRGVQLLLGSESNPQAADTLIMANLGYFQFKANPGYWNLQLKPGRSAEIFDVDTIGSNDRNSTSSDTHLALMSWQGKTIFPRFSRKKGKEEEDVLAEPKAAPAGDFFAKAKSFGQSILTRTGAVTQRKHADINIFSVASGHLYERMLNIMMLSVMKNTKHTVKFWFIEQFLSPAFKSTIPHLAEAYGFDYELVTYKWPHWLRAQKEKQREIWGYKILFLDVLFPLDLDKVIFVDSDQIVRTDMYELVTHDLEGAPYGFTPMCDSRVEMEGFRFWKQGYWRNFLKGLPYHISALYVVDLKRFRAMAAGDRLRGQYHQLSADPESLSNLDQDLPNNMQMQLPIHSLPQEWLWCETWCSDESLKDARTIDLCNNPLTKEPKLDRARRQIPEWTVYDEEVAEVLKQARLDEGKEAVSALDSARIQEEMDRQAKKEFDEEKRSKEKDEL